MISFASSLPREIALTPSLMAFYATIATVIPVLFIALAVQSTMFKWVAVNYSRPLGDSPFVKELPARLGVFRIIFGGAGQLMLGLVSVLILVAGAGGEFIAIYALYQGGDYSVRRLFVLISAAFLIVMVAAGPFLAFVRNAFLEPDKKDAKQDQ